jgi:hypothetical protein
MNDWESPAYDTKAGILRYVADLAGLNQLIAKRHQAGYERRERLSEFCVLGRFYFDMCGNCGVMVERVPAELYHRNTARPQDTCPAVMTRDELILFMRGESFVWESPGDPCAPADATCSFCGVGWTIADCHDVEFIHSDKSWLHSRCFRRERARKQRSEFEQMFATAGFPKVNLVATRNEYWPRSEMGDPWYLAQVGEGAVLKIGWRKRVIHIDWSATQKDLSLLFEGEDVTKSRSYIHAWGYEKAAAYLAKLVPALASESIEATLAGLPLVVACPVVPQ